MFVLPTAAHFSSSPVIPRQVGRDTEKITPRGGRRFYCRSALQISDVGLLSQILGKFHIIGQSKEIAPDLAAGFLVELSESGLSHAVIFGGFDRCLIRR